MPVGKERRLFQFRDDFPIFNAALVGRLAKSGIETMPACVDLKLPAVPRTGHDVAPQRPLAERPSGMRTNAVDDMEDSSNVKHGEDLSISNHLGRSPGRHEFRIDQ